MKMKLLSKTKLAVFLCTLLSLCLSDVHAQQVFGVVTFPNPGPATAQSITVATNGKELREARTPTL